MSNNTELKNLHFARMNRLTVVTIQPKTKTVSVAVGPDSAFSCSVCYTDGSETGIVTPAHCSHKICLGCYTQIAILHKANAKCPECRTLYNVVEAATAETAATEDDYADMPPLIHASYLQHYSLNHGNMLFVTATQHSLRLDPLN